MSLLLIPDRIESGVEPLVLTGGRGEANTR